MTILQTFGAVGVSGLLIGLPLAVIAAGMKHGNRRNDFTRPETFWLTWAVVTVFFGAVFFMTAGKR
jgi:hypothetical protein